MALTFEDLALEEPGAAEDAPACSEHSETLAEICCVDCGNLPICVVCGHHGKHKGHIIRGVRELAAEERNKIKDLMEVLKEQDENVHGFPAKLAEALQLLEDNIAKTKVSIRSQYNEEAEKIDEKISKLYEVRFRHYVEVDMREKEEIVELNRQRKMEMKTVNYEEGVQINKKTRELHEVLAQQKRINDEHDKRVSEVEAEAADERGRKRRAASRTRIGLTMTRSYLDKAFAVLISSVDHQGTTNMKTFAELSEQSTQRIKRYDNFMLTVSSALASHIPWTDVRCLPDINVAGKLLIEDAKKKFPETEALSKVTPNRITPVVLPKPMFRRYPWPRVFSSGSVEEADDPIKKLKKEIEDELSLCEDVSPADIQFDDLPQTVTLTSLQKNRVKPAGNRRPPTRTRATPNAPDGPNDTSLCVEAVISKEGGTLEIPNTGVKLDIPRDAVPQRFTIRMKVIGSQSVDPQPRSFSSNSTTVVELLSEGFKMFRRPAKLTLPHCLHLRKGFQEEVNQVTVYESHHDAGTKPMWRENPNTTYILGDTNCTLLIWDFSWKRYEVNDEIIEAKDITLYAAKRSPETPYPTSLLIDVGYYPGQLGSVSQNIIMNTTLTVLLRKVVKVGKKPIVIAFEKSMPEGTWASEPKEKVISSVGLILNPEDSRTFELGRLRTTSAELLSEEKCHFKVSQGNANDVGTAELIFYIQRVQLATQQRTEREPGVSEGNDRECRDDLTNVVTIRQLRKLSMYIPDDWKFVGRSLEMEEAVLDEIFRDYVATGGVREASYQMLRRWKTSTGSDGTVHKLADALEDSGRRDLQERLIRHEFDT